MNMRCIGAEVWDEVRTVKQRNRFRTTQRPAGAYRTVSTEAALSLPGCHRSTSWLRRVAFRRIERGEKDVGAIVGGTDVGMEGGAAAPRIHPALEGNFTFRIGEDDVGPNRIYTDGNVCSLLEETALSFQSCYLQSWLFDVTSLRYSCLEACSLIFHHGAILFLGNISSKVSMQESMIAAVSWSARTTRYFGGTGDRRPVFSGHRLLVGGICLYSS